MDSETLKNFLVVAREGNITRAAQFIHITQPTLSHDMKVLSEAGIVKQKREGKNIYYSLNTEALAALHQTLGRMFEDKPDCICRQKNG